MRRLQGIQKAAIFAVMIVGHDPIESHVAVGRGALDQLGGDLRLGLKPNVPRNTGLLTPRPIVDPFLGQVKLMVQQRLAGWHGGNQKHTNLAVLGLAQMATVLPLDAHAVRAALLETRFIDHAHDPQQGPSGRGQQLFRHMSLKLILHVLGIPGRLGQKSLQGEHLLGRGSSSCRRRGEVQRDRFDTLAALRLQQPGDIRRRMAAQSGPSEAETILVHKPRQLPGRRA